MTTKTKKRKIAEIRCPADVLAPFMDPSGYGAKEGMTKKLSDARKAWLADKLAEINATPNREGKLVGIGSYRCVSVYETTSVPARIQLRGCCQVCGAEQAVQDNLIVLHGYERPGYGYIVGNCDGMNHPPAQLSIDLATKRRVWVAAELVEAEARRDQLEAEMNGLKTWPAGMTYETGGKERFAEARAMETDYWKARSHASGVKDYLDMIDTHVLPKFGQPLREVLIAD